MEPLKNLEERFYKAGLWLKGANGVLELIGAVLVVVLPDSSINRVIVFLLQQGVEEGKRDALLEAVSRSLTGLVGNRGFAIFYLVGHGVVKIFLVTFLFMGKRWAYPIAIGAMALFMVYEGFRLAVHPTAMLGFILALELAITTLIVRHALQEGRRSKQG